MPFPDQRLTRKYYSIITGMLNQQNAIVKVLTGGFSPQKERFGGFPSHAICATVHIKSTWNFMLLGLSVLCGWSACVCVFVCAWGSFSLTHTCMQNSAYTKTHTRRGIFHLRREARPPSAFLTCNHVQICTGRQGEGESHVNLCGCFLFFLGGGVSYKTRFWLPPISDARDPNHLLKPFKLSNTELEKHFPLCPFFQLKVKICSGKEEGCLCQITST